MKKLSVVLISALCTIAMSSSLAQAQENSPTVKCDDYYKFGSVNVNVPAVGSNWFIPGEKVTFKGFLTNENDYPLVDGSLFVRIGKRNPNRLLQGNFIIDEFTAVRDISIDGQKSKEVTFDWTVPLGTSDGDYQVDFYFMSGKVFSISGLAFTYDILGGSDFITVKNVNKDKSVYFDLDNAKVNGKKYPRVGEFVIDPKDPISIEQPITNNFDKEISVILQKELYQWDDMDPTNRLQTDTSIIKIPAGETQIIKYDIGEPKFSTTYVRLVATYGSNRKSITGIRVLTDKPYPRIAFPGLTKFPIKAGETATLFTCFHNAATSDTKGSIESTLTDKKGNVVAKANYSGNITGAVQAIKNDFKASSGYGWLKMNVVVKDSDGNVKQKYETVYDCNFINPDSCNNLETVATTLIKNRSKSLILIIIILLIAGLIFFLIKRKRKISSQSPTIMRILVFFVAAGAFFASSNFAQACSVDSVWAVTNPVTSGGSTYIRYSTTWVKNCTGSIWGSSGTLWRSGKTSIAGACLACSNYSTGALTSGVRYYVECQDLTTSALCSKFVDVAVTAPTCTSFSYGSWGSCSGGTQTRSATGSPSGCTGGSPVTSQTCCTVDSFYPVSSSVQQGTNTYLYWTASYTRSTNRCQLSGGNVWTGYQTSEDNTSAQNIYTTTGAVNSNPTNYTMTCWASSGASCSRTTSVSMVSTCTSFSYGSWGSCSGGTQTRSATGSPSGCTGGSPVTSQTCCTVDSFYPVSSSVTSGSNTWLYWTASYTRSTNRCQLSGGNVWTGYQTSEDNTSAQNIYTTTGAVNSNPTNYTMTCWASSGASCSRTTSVNTTPLPACTASISASPNPIGYNTGSTVTWSSTNAVSCTGTRTAGTSGTLWTSTQAITLSGLWGTGNLTGNTSYNITCLNSAGIQCQASTTVNVNSPTLCTASITADKNPVDYNTSTIVRWSSNNIKTGSCKDYNGNGVVASGSWTTGNLTSPATYKLTCRNADDTADCTSGNYTVSVKAAPACTVGSFTAATNPVAYNNGTYFNWSTSNVRSSNSCVFSGGAVNTGWQIANWSGGNTGFNATGNLTSNTSYTITCYNDAGLACSKNLTVSVNAPTLCTASIAADTNPVDYNTSTIVRWSSNNIKTGSCKDYNGNGVVASGSWTTGNLTSPATYKLTCRNADDTADCTSGNYVVSVKAAPACTASISASPNPVGYNNGSTVTWSSTNAVSCTGTRTAGSSGTLWTSTQAITLNGTWGTGNLTGNTSYNITCLNSAGIQCQANTTVNVNSPTLCTASITADKNPVDYNTSTIVRWSSTNILAGSCKDINNNGVIGSGFWTTGNLTSPATYKLTCRNADNTADCTSGNYTVSVLAAPACTVDSVTATPSSIGNGGNATITWASTNAVSCTGSRTAGTSGTLWTSPTALVLTTNSIGMGTGNLTNNTTYKVECVNQVGTACSRSVNITVAAAPACTASISASPNPVGYNNGSTVTWSSTNAVSCTGTRTAGSSGTLWTSTQAITLNGFWGTGNLTDNNTYNITCLNAGGLQCQANTTVNVNSPTLCTASIWADANPVEYGASTTVHWSSTNILAGSCKDINNNGVIGSGFWTTGNLTSPATYKLTCRNADNTADCTSGNYTVGVNAAVPCTVNSVTSDKISSAASPLPNGSTATVTWASTGAVSCTGSRTAGTSGTLWTSPTPLVFTTNLLGMGTGNLNNNTTYKVECQNLAGTKCSKTLDIYISSQVFDSNKCNNNPPDDFYSWGFNSPLHSSQGAPINGNSTLGCVGEGNQSFAGMTGIHYWVGMENSNYRCDNSVGFLQGLTQDSQSATCGPVSETNTISSADEPIKFNATAFGGYVSIGTWWGTPPFNVPSIMKISDKGLYIWDVFAAPPASVNQNINNLRDDIKNWIICTSSSNQTDRNGMNDKYANWWNNSNVLTSWPTITSSNPSALYCENDWHSGDYFKCTPNRSLAAGTYPVDVTITFPSFTAVYGSVRYCFWDQSIFFGSVPGVAPFQAKTFTYKLKVEGSKPLDNCDLKVLTIKTGATGYVESTDKKIVNCNEAGANCEFRTYAPGQSITLNSKGVTPAGTKISWLVYDGTGKLLGDCSGNPANCTFAMGKAGDNETTCSRKVYANFTYLPCTVAVNATSPINSGDHSTVSWITTNICADPSKCGCWGWQNNPLADPSSSDKRFVGGYNSGNEGNIPSSGFGDTDNLTQSKRYQVTCWNENGNCTGSANVDVILPPCNCTPPVPGNCGVGSCGPTERQWTKTCDTTCPPADVPPLMECRYDATCTTNFCGTVKANISASTPVTSGNASTISWNSSNATWCWGWSNNPTDPQSIDNDHQFITSGQMAALSGTGSSFPLTADRRFIIECGDAIGNNCIKEAMVTVPASGTCSGVTVPGNHATNCSYFFSEPSIAATGSIPANTSFTADVSICNNGTTDWSVFNAGTNPNGHRMGSMNPYDNDTWGPGRYDAGITVAAGSNHTYHLSLMSPSTSGFYNFQLGMLQEGIEWFNDPCPNVPISVTDAPGATCTADLSANPSNINVGDSSTLTWLTTGAPDTCTINSTPVMPVAGGTKTVSPTTSGDNYYVLSCNQGGAPACSSAPVPITVNAPGICDCTTPEAQVAIANVCQGKSFTFTCPSGGTVNCIGTRSCSSDWREVPAD